MIRRPPRSTRTDTLFPYTTLFRAGFGRAAQFAVRAFLIGRANEEAEPLFGVLPRNLAGDLRVEFLGGVRIGALGRNEARPGRPVERPAGVEDHRAADAALFAPRLGRFIDFGADA